MRVAATAGALALALAASGGAMALALVVPACDEGSPASPAFQSGPATGEAGEEDAGDAAYAVCPPDLDATFGSLYTQIFSTSSCGTDQPNNCHSAGGALAVGNLLDFSLDAGAVAVYAELLGADGGGHRSTNEDHPDVDVPRVVPFDASASMLYIKLTITSTNDPQYGGGMPLTAPGSVCPATLAAVQAWINAGATFEPEEGGTPEAGPGSDAATDADAGAGGDATLD